MVSARATKCRFTLWTDAVLLVVLGTLWALPQSALGARSGPRATATALDHDTVNLT